MYIYRKTYTSRPVLVCKSDQQGRRYKEQFIKSRLSLLELGRSAPQACVASRRRVCYPLRWRWDRLLLARVWLCEFFLF